MVQLLNVSMEGGAIRPQRSFLPPGGIDLWFMILPLNIPIAELMRCLSPIEVRRAGTFAGRDLQCSYCAAHAALRLILASYADIAPAAITFVQGPFGKPGVALPELRFNMSHSGGAVLVGVAHRPLGVDVEDVRRTASLEAVADLFLERGERAAIAQQPVARRQAELLRRWTGKEACAKALGLGLQFDLRCLAPWRGGYACDGHGSFVVCSLRPASGFIAAIAVRGSEPEELALTTLRQARLHHDHGLELAADPPVPLASSIFALDGTG